MENLASQLQSVGLVGLAGRGGLKSTQLKSYSYVSKGGFAIVYKAQLCNPDGVVTPVAVKVLRPRSNAQYCKRFLQEVAVHSTLLHSNIVQLKGFCTIPMADLTPVTPPGLLDFATDGSATTTSHATGTTTTSTTAGSTGTDLGKMVAGPAAVPAVKPGGKAGPGPELRGPSAGVNCWAVVLEFMQDGNLYDRLVHSNTPDTYSCSQAVEWLMQIADAVRHLHSHCPLLIHRDLKPENILLQRHPVTGKVMAKLGDFGLLAAIDNKGNKIKLPEIAHPDALLLGTGIWSSSILTDQPGPGSSAAGPLDGPPGMPSQPPLISSACTVAGPPSAVTGMYRQSLLNSAGLTAAGPFMGAAGMPSQQSPLNSVGRLINSNSALSTGMQGCALGAANRVSGSSLLPGAPVEPMLNPFTITANSSASGLGQQQQSSQAQAPIALNSRRRQPSQSWSGTASTDTRDQLSPGAAGVDGGVRHADEALPCIAELHEGDVPESPSKLQAVADLRRSYGQYNQVGLEFMYAKERTGVASKDHVPDIFQVHFRLTARCGSALYMAPEVARGKMYNEKVDVFSFGIVMYELLSRSLLCQTDGPDAADRAMDHLAKVAWEGWRPALPDHFPKELQLLIKLCWHQEARVRPNFATVYGRLSEVLQSKSLQQMEAADMKLRKAKHNMLQGQMLSGIPSMYQQMASPAAAVSSVVATASHLLAGALSSFTPGTTRGTSGSSTSTSNVSAVGAMSKNSTGAAQQARQFRKSASFQHNRQLEASQGQLSQGQQQQPGTSATPQQQLLLQLQQKQQQLQQLLQKHNQMHVLHQLQPTIAGQLQQTAGVSPPPQQHQNQNQNHMAPQRRLMKSQSFQGVSHHLQTQVETTAAGSPLHIPSSTREMPLLGSQLVTVPDASRPQDTAPVARPGAGPSTNTQFQRNLGVGRPPLAPVLSEITPATPKPMPSHVALTSPVGYQGPVTDGAMSLQGLAEQLNKKTLAGIVTNPQVDKALQRPQISTGMATNHTVGVQPAMSHKLMQEPQEITAQKLGVMGNPPTRGSTTGAAAAAAATMASASVRSSLTGSAGSVAFATAITPHTGARTSPSTSITTITSEADACSPVVKLEPGFSGAHQSMSREGKAVGAAGIGLLLNGQSSDGGNGSGRPGVLQPIHHCSKADLCDDEMCSSGLGRKRSLLNCFRS